MKKTVYEDNKYSMQDTGNLYIGCKYTMGEIIEEENITFKFRLIVERYLLQDSDLEDTLETYLYYLEEKNFAVKILKQLRARVKVNVIEEKKHLGGRIEKCYVTRMIPIEKLVALPVAEKEKCGMVVQELALSKLALMAF